MIYQMKIYYGAILEGKVIYSLESSLEDCTSFPEKLSEISFKHYIVQAIINDGFNPNDFTIGYLTKEQYENRNDIENEKVTTWSVSK